MNIFDIGQSTGVDQIAAIQGRKNYAQTSNSSTKGDTISISPEAMAMYRVSQVSSEQTSSEKAVVTSSASVSFLGDKQSQGSSRNITAKITACMIRSEKFIWHADMMLTYLAEIVGQSSITVQGVTYEHSPAWETYTSSMGKHYENALDSHNFGDSIEERYNAL